MDKGSGFVRSQTCKKVAAVRKLYQVTRRSIVSHAKLSAPPDRAPIVGVDDEKDRYVLPVIWLITEKGIPTVSILDHGTEAGFYC
jgi:hypothetical protein